MESPQSSLLKDDVLNHTRVLPSFMNKVEAATLSLVDQSVTVITRNSAYKGPVLLESNPSHQITK